MTKTKLLTTLVFTLCVFTNCEKNPDEITVKLDQSGSVSVKVVDSQKNPVPDARVSISLSSSYSLFDGITDKNGQVYGSYITRYLFCFSNSKKRECYV